MFDISFTELLFVVVLAVIFIGPKELPVVMRTVARAFFQVKKFWNEVKAAMGDIAKETGIDDIKRELENDLNPDVTMIKGDDGQWHEAYDMDELKEINVMRPLDANDSDADKSGQETTPTPPTKGADSE